MNFFRISEKRPHERSIEVLVAEDREDLFILFRRGQATNPLSSLPS